MRSELFLGKRLRRKGEDFFLKKFYTSWRTHNTYVCVCFIHFGFPNYAFMQLAKLNGTIQIEIDTIGKSYII